jgi:hypothetical protein
VQYELIVQGVQLSIRSADRHRAVENLTVIEPADINVVSRYFPVIDEQVAALRAAHIDIVGID